MPQLSVLWTDVRSLKHFAFRSDHVSVLHPAPRVVRGHRPPNSVLWWRQASLTRGLEPSLAEAFDRLRDLKARAVGIRVHHQDGGRLPEDQEAACLAPSRGQYDAVAARVGPLAGM